MTKMQAITLCFGLYVLSISVFARRYQVLYRRHPEWFLFHSDVRRSQRDYYVGETLSKANLLRAQLEVLSDVLQRLRAGATLRDLANDRPTTLTSGRRYVVTTDISLTDESNIPDYRIKCSNPDGTEFDAFAMDEGISTYYKGDQLGYIDGLIRKKQRLIDDCEKEVQVASTTGTNIWEFVDFFYFSAIAQTTVGFGDILPNNPKVRVLVVVQIMIGYGIIVGLLNALLVL